MDDGLTPELRRMMVEYGEQFWGSGWKPLYGFLGGNPLAAMPSLHFATSVTAARLLAETGRTAGVPGLGLRGHARRRARLPGGALRRRPRSPGSRSRRASAGARRAVAPLARARVAHRRSCWRPARAHDGVRGAGAAGRRRSRGRTTTSARRCSSRGATCIALAGFLLASLAGALLPAAPDRRPRRHVEPDRRRAAGVDRRRPAVHVRHVRRLRRDVPRRLRARGRRGSAGGRATRSRWRASPRRACSPRAAPAGWC